MPCRFEVKEKYFVTGIPHNILVHPNGDMEVVDVRNEADLKMVYALFTQD